MLLPPRLIACMYGVPMGSPIPPEGMGDAVCINHLSEHKAGHKIKR